MGVPSHKGNHQRKTGKYPNPTLPHPRQDPIPDPRRPASPRPGRAPGAPPTFTTGLCFILLRHFSCVTLSELLIWASVSSAGKTGVVVLRGLLSGSKERIYGKILSTVPSLIKVSSFS